MIRILLVDDHPLMRAGLRAILDSAPAPVTIVEASCFEQALNLLRKQSWDAVVLDMSLSGKSGLSLLRQTKEEYPNLPVLMLSIHSDSEYGMRALKAGANGYLDKRSAPEHLLVAIENVLVGKRYISPAISEVLATQIAGGSSLDLLDSLTAREFEVFALISAGHSTAEAANVLSVSSKTVHSHRHRVLEKLDLKSNADIVRYAFKRGLVH